mmetsp:Transcript_2564/g.3770  ORF Transcript_2564/g.3770 Transcript_2564/m.3770 type:complete len:160 (-) Transcript_2564:1010-1489(-)
MASAQAALAFERRSTAACIQSVSAEESVLAAIEKAEIDEDAKIALELQAIEDRAAKRCKERRLAREKAQNAARGESWFDIFTVVPPTSETAATVQNRSRSSVRTSSSGGHSSSTSMHHSGGGARVAQSQGIFACIGTSVANAVNPASVTSGEHAYSLLS